VETELSKALSGSELKLFRSCLDKLEGQLESNIRNRDWADFCEAAERNRRIQSDTDVRTD